MSVEPSSRDLHPKTGARFVFDRLAEHDAPRYQVTIYLPRARWSGQLDWSQSDARLSADPEQSELDAAQAWVLDEARKLARVLHRDPRQHMLRWRATPA